MTGATGLVGGWLVRRLDAARRALFRGGLDPRVKQPWLWRGLILTVALGLGLLYASPSLPIVARHGSDWPLRYVGEAASLTTYGKWWLKADGPWLADGFSGQVPVFYNYLSDLLLNVLARLLDRPPMTVQAALWGPLLASLLFVVNYGVLGVVLRDRTGALLASLVISTAGGSGLLSLVSPSARASHVEMLLHLPFDAVSLGTAQSLGWVLFLPSLGLLHLAHRRFTVRRGMAFGACTGLLLHAHTLTFLNAVAAQLAYLVATNLAERPRDARTRAWLAVLAMVGLVFAGLALFRPPLTLPGLVILGGTTLLATFLIDPAKPLYLCGYGTALLVSAPYLLVLARHSLEALPAATTAEAASPAELLLFFAVYVLAAVPAFRARGDKAVHRWAVSLLLTTVFLAMNHLWRWENHPYRFAINLVFPLAILAALGVRRSSPALRMFLLACLATVSLVNLRTFLGGDRRYVRLVEEGASAPLLRAVREATARAEARDASVLNPPEHNYPIGVGQNAVLFNYSHRPGFVPDFRYVLARERYFNRLALFCFLFPGYPAYDFPLDRRACEEPLDPSPDVVTLLDPGLRAAVLPIYGIGYAAAVGRPFAVFLDRARIDYGWEIVARGVGRQCLLRASAPARPGLARFRRGRWDDAGLHVDLETDTGGRQVVVLGGRRLTERAERVLLDGRRLEARARSPNWALFEAEMETGPHRLELRWPESARRRDPEYLYFAAVVAAGHASGLLGRPEARESGNEARPTAVSSGGNRP